jgi:hypothetical protein
MSESGQKRKGSNRAFHVRFSPDSGERADITEGPSCANSVHFAIHSTTLSGHASVVGGRSARVRGNAMRVVSTAVAAKIGFMILLTQGVAANAAEIKVKAGAATTAVLKELGPQFERATGHKVALEFGLSGTFKRQIEAGESFDIAIIAPAMLDDLIKQARSLLTRVPILLAWALAWRYVRVRPSPTSVRLMHSSAQ